MQDLEDRLARHRVLDYSKITVVLVGKRWDLLKRTIATLEKRGLFTFQGPMGHERGSGAQLCLLGPDIGLSRKFPKFITNDGLPMPLLLCVPWHTLRDEDLYARAEDFVAVPRLAEELGKRIARLAGHRRWSIDTQKDSALHPGIVLLNPETHEMIVAGVPVTLTRVEFQLPHFLMLHRGRIFPREEFVRQVWGAHYSGGLRTVDVRIRRIRSKLGPERERWLRTVRSVGYGWDKGMETPGA